MPPQLTYPGVYVQEVSSGVVSISGVATSIALFIGMTPKGPMRQPRLVQNFTSFATLFGSESTAGELPDQVRQFFLNGGAQAYVMRVATGDFAAQVILDNEFGAPVLQFDARDSGLIGETIRLEVDYNTSQPEATFNLTVYREVADATGMLQKVEGEVHKDLETDPNGARYVVSILDRDSNLVRATAVAGVLPINGYALAGVVGQGGTAAAALTNLELRVTNAVNAAIVAAGGTVGRFEISVDGAGFVPVALTSPATIATISAAVTAAVGATATVSAPALPAAGAGGGFLRALRIQSAVASARSSVRLRRVSTRDDIAAALQMGTEDGGLEVSGGTSLRPMANGIVARLGPAAGDLDGVAALFRQLRSDVTGITLTDSSGPINAPIAFGGAPADRLLFNGGSGEFSLGEARASIAAIVAGLNAAFLAAPPPRRWSATQCGLRVVLTTFAPFPDAGIGTTLATVGGGAFSFAVQPYLLTPGRVNVRSYRLGGYGAVLLTFSNGSQAGVNGTSPLLAGYDAAFEIVRREVDLFNLMILPRNMGQVDTVRVTLWGPASVFCKQRRAVLIMDPGLNWRDPATDALPGVIALRTGLVKDHTAVYWPRLLIADPATGLVKDIDPAGTVAGICSRTDTSRGVWKAPAGLEASLLGVRGVQRKMSDDENGTINPAALNAIRAFPSGVVIWGARTVDGFDNSGNTDYRYLPVRRTALMIEESLYRGLQFALFEPNDEPLWAQIRLAAGAFMNGLFRQGAFQGQKSSDAYFVKCDSETTTQTDINLGIVNVVVGFAALKPAEFIVLIVKQKAGQIQT